MMYKGVQYPWRIKYSLKHSPFGEQTGESTLASLKSNVREAVHRVAQKYRERQKENEWKREFDEMRAVHGAMAAKATWQDYLDAYGHTRCSVREYFLFKFYEKDRETRDSYLTLQRRNRFIHQIHDDESCNATVPGNKVLFNMLFEPYLCREWINPTVATAEEFVAFVKKLGKVMLKPACDGKGHGITIYEYTTDEDAAALHDTLVGAAMIAEEVLVQHPQVDLLNPNCINTVRVATYTDRDDEHMVLASLRSARGDAIVDNFAAGGIHMAVDVKTGVICSDATDEEMHVYPTHPLTGTKLKGFQLPNWDKALDVLHRASRDMYALPGCRYLGWDIAFLKNGEVSVIECNWRQGVEAQQPHSRGIYHELDALRQKL